MNLRSPIPPCARAERQSIAVAPMLGSACGPQRSMLAERFSTVSLSEVGHPEWVNPSSAAFNLVNPTLREPGISALSIKQLN